MSMNRTIKTLDKRLQDNIRDYSVEMLFDLDLFAKQAEAISTLLNVGILLTDRHGVTKICTGDITDKAPDVVKIPGRKIRVVDRTIAHVYLDFSKVDIKKQETIILFMEQTLSTIERAAELKYADRERELYIDELEEILEKERYQAKYSEKTDALTEVLNHTYFNNRMHIIDRSQIIPVGIIVANINDWKYANEQYGDEESDRLIQIVASILKDAAKPEYVIGRVDGDVFHILIPMPEEGECEEYCKMIREVCNDYQDDILAPSIAIGMVMKENVEETLPELFSEAEYKMFEDKLIIKAEESYQKRLHKEEQF